MQKYLRRIHNLFVFTNKLSLQLQNSNDVVTWDYKDNNKNNKNNNIKINQTVPREISKHFCSKLVYHVILTKIPSIVI